MKTALILASLVVLGAADAVAQTTSTCLPSPSTDSVAIQWRSAIRDLVTSKDTGQISVRKAMLLGTQDSTKVVFVTDDAVCAKVAQGINTAQKQTGVIRQLWVLKVGTLFAAKDPGHPSGEWWPTVTLDSKYVVKAVVLSP